MSAKGWPAACRKAGSFGPAPYGYRNVRKDGRGVVEIDPRPRPTSSASSTSTPTNPHARWLVERINAEGRSSARSRRGSPEARSTTS